MSRVAGAAMVAFETLTLGVVGFVGYAGYLGLVDGAGRGFWWGWSVVMFVLVASVVVAHRGRASTFTLDLAGRPITGRDADRYAAYRARLCPHERQALDDFFAGLQDNEE